MTSSWPHPRWATSSVHKAWASSIVIVVDTAVRLSVPPRGYLYRSTIISNLPGIVVLGWRDSPSLIPLFANKPPLFGSFSVAKAYCFGEFAPLNPSGSFKRTNTICSLFFDEKWTKTGVCSMVRFFNPAS